jgi:general nucleoside transport system ATP-binding protein
VEARLQIEGVSRAFPGVKAVDDVSLTVQPGEIHALLGENGAGKSTLVKIIYGVLQADSGHMTFDGAPFRPQSPAEARASGVGMVFQHFSVFEALTVAENVALALPGAVADAALAARIVSVSRTYGLDLDPSRLVGTLSAGERQRIEIVRCLLQDPRLIIMDEPTSVLTPGEATRLFETLRTLAGEGRSILYISHKLEEIRVLCGSATILRAGQRVAQCDPRTETARRLAEMMIGETLTPPVRAEAKRGEVRLAINDLALPAEGPFGVTLQDIILDVHAGEIVGIAGVAGNGQGELMEALIGERRTKPLAITVDGEAVGHIGPRARRGKGLAFVPEERLGHGAVPSASLTENMALAETTRGRVGWRNLRTAADAVIARFGVKTPSAAKPAQSLSGGNLQKFIVGREISKNPAVFIAAQPTWGVDAGAAALIHNEIAELARGGAAVLIISQDLDELFAVCHHIAVIAGGRLTAARSSDVLTAETLGRAMGAAHV